MPGKTRTSSAHGPTAAKKPFKASGSTSKPPPRSNSSTYKPRDSSAATGGGGGGGGDRKRKAPEDDAAAGSAVPDKVEIKSSLLNAPEEIDFPRGGGTGLTQVEVREAQLEGENEAMELGLDQDEEKKRDTEVIKDKGKAKRRKLERALQAQVKEKNILPKDAFRVEHLNYKRLVPGTKVFAQIVQVRPLELIVSLPNQLLAHVPITNLSPEFTKRLEAAGEESDSASDDESDDEVSDEDDEPSSISSLPGLPTLFKVGQWVSAVVTASKPADSKQKLGGREGDENVRTSRRVELSLEPEKVNEGVAKGDLKQRGFTLSCVVHDIEPDSGYTLSFGLPSLQSFISFADAKKQSGLKRLEIGQVLLCRIKKMNDNERTCTVSIDQKEIAASTLENVSSITSLLPSHLVSCLITSVLPSGLNVKFFGFYDGTIDLFHLPLAPSASVEDAYKVGQKIKARIMWDAVGSSPKKFSLSAADWVVAMDEKKVDGVKVETKYPIGTTLDRVKVVRMDDEWGLTVEIIDRDDTQDREAGFVHISRITDDHLNTIPKNGPWKVGTVHRARVVGFSPVDGLVQLSLQPSVLEMRFLRVVDAQVGEVIKATVKRLSDSAIFLDVAGNVDGVVWPMHYADIRLKHPEKKFKPGQVVKARIFAADSVKNRVVLTLKKQLVASELPIVSRIEDAQVGLVTQATVTKVNEKSVLVDFFGGLRALIPAAEAAESFSTDLTKLFTAGKVITVRLISVDRANSRILASVRQVDNPSTANARVQNSSAEIDSIDIGTILSGTISAVHDTNIVLSLVPSGVKALISFPTLARHRALSVEDLRLTLEKGQTLEDLVVVSKNADKGFVIVGLVPSSSSKSSATAGSSISSSSTTGITISNLSTGTVYTGKIHSKIPTGLLVQISKTVRGRVALTEMGDDFEQVSKTLASEFAPGRQVRCVVLSKDEDNRRVDLSLRASRAAAVEEEGKAVDVKDRPIDKIDDVPKVGSVVRGFVKNVANHGLFVQLGAEITARVQIKELFDEYVKDWKPRFSIGQVVEGKVLAVNKVTSQVEMTLRKSANVKENQQSSISHSDLEKGAVMAGVVRRIEPYGVFVKLAGTNIQGLCHKTKVTDDEGSDWKESVKEGQAVKVVIMEVNVDKKKVSLGLKRSLFPEDYEGSSDDDDDEDEDEDDEQEEEEEEDEEDDEMADEGEFDSDEGEDIDIAALLKAQGGDGDDSDAEMDDDEEPSAPVASTSKLPAVNAAPLAVSAGFNWDGDEDEQARDEHGSDSDDDDDEEVLPAAATDASTSVAAGKRSTAGLSALDDRTGDLDTQAPTSIADFERLLLGSPNSSYLWIQYIAFFVGLSQLDKAREIAKRALATISFREEGEKLNVWVALLNLENAYGDDSTLEDTFKDAAQANDAKTVHLKLIDIYERSGKFDAEEELFKKTVKKFSQSSKVWTLFGQYYLTHGRPNEARELLPRSLKSLEKRKHVETISKFAQLEFKLGDAERGRTIFEGIMDSYPKRLDLWFIYIDMEIKQRNVEGVRALFERVLANRLSSKKGKSVFKKWLTFEKEFGDEEGVETVKERAIDFVQSRTGGGDDDDE